MILFLSQKPKKHKAVGFRELLNLSFCGIILCGFFGEVRMFQCNQKGDDNTFHWPKIEHI